MNQALLNKGFCCSRALWENDFSVLHKQKKIGKSSSCFAVFH